MAGAYTARHVDAEITRHGESATLSRTGEATAITLQAKRYGSVENDIGGSAAQSRITVKIGTAALAASAWTDKYPKRADKLAIGGRTRVVTDVDTRGDAGATALYILTVDG